MLGMGIYSDQSLMVVILEFKLQVVHFLKTDGKSSSISFSVSTISLAYIKLFSCQNFLLHLHETKIAGKALEAARIQRNSLQVVAWRPQRCWQSNG